MADTEIKFKIASVFDGEGFAKSEAAIKANRREISAASRGLGELTNAFKGISPEAANAVTAIKGVASAFVAGGIVGGGIQLAIQGISTAISFMRDKWEEAAEATRKYAEILKTNILAAMGDATASFAALRQEMAQADKEAQDILKVLNGDVAHEAAAKVYQLKVDAMNQITEEMTAEERGVIEALRDKQIAIVKAAAADEQAANAIDAYRTILDNAGKTKEASAARLAEAENGLADMTEQSREYLAKRKQIEDYIATQEERFAEGQINLHDILVARKESALALKNLEDENSATVKNLSDANTALANAKRDAAAADYAYTQAQNNLHAAVQKRDETLQAVTLAEKEGALKVQDAQKKDADAKEKLAEAEQKAADDWHEFLNGQVLKLRNATEGLAEAEEKAAKELEGSDIGGGNDKKKLAENVRVTNPKEIGTSVGVGVNVNAMRGDIQKPKKLDDATWNRFQNGLANAADMARIQRFQEQDQRTAYNSLNRIKADAVKFIKIVDQPEAWRSAADNNFIEMMKTKVFTQLPADVASKLLGDAGKHLLTSETMKEILGNNGALIQYFTKMFAQLGVK